MYFPDIIIPTIKDAYGIAPMVCALEGYSQDCRVISTCQKSSAAINRNVGLKQAKKEIVIMLDDDISGFYPGWHEDLVRPLLENPDIIYVTADLVRPDGSAGAMMFRSDGEGYVDVPRAPTAAVAFRVVPGIAFDERYVGSGFEDDDFCAQLAERFPGKRFVLNKNVKLIHANEEKGRQHGNFERNKKYFDEKWETIGNSRIRRGLRLPWKRKIESIFPSDLPEIPNRDVYMANEKRFSFSGFTRDVFLRLFPIMEEQVWSAFALFSLARFKCADRSDPLPVTILEIGSGRGGSICTIGLANPTAKLINIDKFGHYDETSAFGTVKDYQGFIYEGFRENVKPFGILDRLTTIRKWSHEAVNDIPDGSCDMIFIDGNHSYEPFKQDLLDYWPKLRSGGIFCGHDYHPLFPGVIKALKDLYGEDGYDVMENSSVWVKGE